MIWFLRLFQHFRDLEATAAEKVRLSDQIESLLAEQSWLRQQMSECMENERKSYQMLVNFEYQAKAGVAPFPDAPKLPPSTMERMAREPENRAQFAHGFDLVDRGRREFMQGPPKRQGT